MNAVATSLGPARVELAKYLRAHWASTGVRVVSRFAGGYVETGPDYYVVRLSFLGLGVGRKHMPMPKLERVFIDDHVSNPRSGLAACFITGWVSGFHPDQKVSITVTHAGSSSDIDNALLPWTCDNSVAREFGDVPLRLDYVGFLMNYSMF